MPANLTPEYKKAEAAFKNARDSRERLDCLREMLRTIPKHKGTERLQADIKTRIKQLTDELATTKKGGGRRGPSYAVRPEGAAQIALIGAPNVGKSALHAQLTGSHAEIGPYPFTTATPLPGMLPFEDIHFQLIDLPPVSRDHPVPWIVNTLQPADGCMLVVDLEDAECLEQVQTVIEVLREKRVTLLPSREPSAEAGDGPEDEAAADPFAVRLPTLLVATKADESADPEGELEAFQELMDTQFPALAVSAETGKGSDQIALWWFETFSVVRVYTKVPGHAAEMDHPFTLRRGDTVHDVARLVHGDLASGLKYARLWGGQLQGQQVGRDHAVADGDVLELHV
ncbi:MAG: GTPase [Myxococcota bacterium]